MTQWTMAAVGDVLFEQPPAVDNPALALLQEADIAFANLEMPLSTKGYPADKTVAVRGHPSLAECLTTLGVGVVSLANNHAGDYGVEALIETAAAVERQDVAIIGAGKDLGEALAPAFIDVAGTRVAWMGMASTLPSGFAATPERPGIAPLRVRSSFVLDTGVHDEQPGTSPWVQTEVLEQDLERVCAAIHDATECADVVVVSLHWGLTPGWTPAFSGPLATYQQPLAHALVDAGAELILGHHPHVLQGIEMYRGKPILYSMGHLVFHALAPGRALVFGTPGPPYRTEAMLIPELAETAVFQLRFQGPKCIELSIVPCVLDDLGEGRPAQGATAARILESLQRASKEMGTDLSVSGDRATLSIS